MSESEGGKLDKESSELNRGACVHGWARFQGEDAYLAADLWSGAGGVDGIWVEPSVCWAGKLDARLADRLQV